MAQEFFSSTLLRTTVGSIYICTLPNERGQGAPERHILTRDLAAITAFIKKWDQKGRGLFYCVSTIDGKHRRKEFYGQTIFLHADVDFKSVKESPEEVEAALRSLNPSRLTWSGNGIHAFWDLFDGIQDDARVTRALQKLAKIVAGDRMVCHTVALMRVPGSHNSKRDSWTEVRTEVLNPTPYELVDLEENLLQEDPVLHYKVEPAETNPFLQTAELLSFKAPVDVEARLRDMQPGNIHDTQLSVTAAMMNAGDEIETIVAKVIQATRPHGQEDWDWRAEERAVRGMCEDWAKKHPQVGKTEKVESTSDGGAEVVSLKDKRQEKMLEGKKGKAKAHVVLGTGLLKDLEQKEQKLISADGSMWLYSAGIWTQFRPEEWKTWSLREIETGCRKLNIVGTTKLVNETKNWLERNPDTFCKDVPWDMHGHIATRSGLVNYKDGEVTALSPDHWATHQVNCEFDPAATCPWFKRMLADMQMEAETISLLQEVLGASLIDSRPRGLRRALVLVGGSNSGKSNLLHVMAYLLSDNPITTPLDMLENAHGLQEFLRRAPWVLDEAFDQSKWHVSATVKALMSGDHIGVNVKNGPQVTHRYRSPIFWGTNTPPQFKEASRAIENRLIIIKCAAEFDSTRPVGAAKEALTRGYNGPADMVLAEEKSGILNWALEGLRRAWARGHFVLTGEMQEALAEMHVESNLAAGFVRDCLDYDKDCMINQADFYAAFHTWWQETHERQHIPGPKSLGRAMAALSDPRIALDNAELRYKKIRYFAGVKLSEVGMDYWRAFSAMSAQRGDASRISASEAEVNCPIPGEWVGKAIIKRMRSAHDER